MIQIADMGGISLGAMFGLFPRAAFASNQTPGTSNALQNKIDYDVFPASLSRRIRAESEILRASLEL